MRAFRGRHRIAPFCIGILLASTQAVHAQPRTRADWLALEDTVWAPVVAVLEAQIQTVPPNPNDQEFASALVQSLGVPEFQAALWNAFITTRQGRPFASNPVFRSGFGRHTNQLRDLLEQLIARRQLIPEIIAAFRPRADSDRVVQDVSGSAENATQLEFVSELAQLRARGRMQDLLGLSTSSYRDIGDWPALIRLENLAPQNRQAQRRPHARGFTQMYAQFSPESAYVDIKAMLQHFVAAAVADQNTRDLLDSSEPDRMLAGLAAVSQSVSDAIRRHIPGDGHEALRSVLERFVAEEILVDAPRRIRRDTRRVQVSGERALVETRFRLIEMIKGGMVGEECLAGGLSEHQSQINASDAAQILLADHVFTLVQPPSGTSTGIHRGSMVTFRLRDASAQSTADPLVGWISRMRSLSDPQLRGVLEAVFRIYPHAGLVIGTGDSMDNSLVHDRVLREFPILMPQDKQRDLPRYEWIQAVARSPVARPMIPGAVHYGAILTQEILHREAQPVEGNEVAWIHTLVSAWRDVQLDRGGCLTWRAHHEHRFQALGSSYWEHHGRASLRQFPRDADGAEDFATELAIEAMLSPDQPQGTWTRVRDWIDGYPGLSTRTQVALAATVGIRKSNSHQLISLNDDQVEIFSQLQRGAVAPEVIHEIGRVLELTKPSESHQMLIDFVIRHAPRTDLDHRTLNVFVRILDAVVKWGGSYQQVLGIMALVDRPDFPFHADAAQGSHNVADTISWAAQYIGTMLLRHPTHYSAAVRARGVAAIASLVHRPEFGRVSIGNVAFLLCRLAHPSDTEAIHALTHIEHESALARYFNSAEVHAALDRLQGSAAHCATDRTIIATRQEK